MISTPPPQAGAWQSGGPAYGWNAIGSQRPMTYQTHLERVVFVVCFTRHSRPYRAVRPVGFRWSQYSVCLTQQAHPRFLTTQGAQS